MANINVATMSAVDKISNAMMRAVPKLPSETGAALQALLTPQNLGIMAGVIVVWAGSHAVGVGAIVDLILLGTGLFVLGWSVFEGAEEIYNFATKAVGASSEQDLEVASDHFAKAVMLLGLAVIQAVLLRGQARPVMANVAKGPTAFKPKPQIKLPPTPPASRSLGVSRVSSIPPRSRGRTDAFGNIKIARYDARTAAPYAFDERKAALYHELVHRYFSPKTGPLRRFRAQARMSAYQRVAFLKYLEEALAQGYGMLRAYGLEKSLSAYRFPIENGYVTVSQLAAEGSMIGTIMLGGTRLHVSVMQGRIQADEVEIKPEPQVPPRVSGPLAMQRAGAH